MVRRVIERLYKDRCEISVKASYKRANGSTGHRDQILVRDQPCKLSFHDAISANAPTSDGAVATTFQIVKLFLSPDIDIPAGSKITVTHGGRTTVYQQSGMPSIFNNHQEILLEAYQKRA